MYSWQFSRFSKSMQNFESSTAHILITTWFHIIMIENSSARKIFFFTTRCIISGWLVDGVAMPEMRHACHGMSRITCTPTPVLTHTRAWLDASKWPLASFNSEVTFASRLLYRRPRFIVTSLCFINYSRPMSLLRAVLYLFYATLT